MKDKLERIAQVATELGACREVVRQKEAELRQLLTSFAEENQVEPLRPLAPKQRLPVRREAHGEMIPKLLLAMQTETLTGNGAIFDAKRIAHVMGCTEQVAKIRLQKAYARGHIDRPEPSKYTLKAAAMTPDPEEPA